LKAPLPPGGAFAFVVVIEWTASAAGPLRRSRDFGAAKSSGRRPRCSRDAGSGINIYGGHQA